MPRAVTGGVDVAFDVRRLAVLLVRVDDERLHERRVDETTDDRHHQPQRRRDQRQPQRTAPHDREVQPRRQQRDQDQQHDRRELRLDDRVRGALDEAALGVGDLVAVEPVVARLHRREHREQHREVRLGRRAHGRHRRREDDAAVEDVGGDREQQHHDQRGEQPVDHERHERQLEDVEADVGTELGVGDAELAGRCGTAATPATAPRPAARAGGRRRRRCRSGRAAGDGRTPRGTARRTGCTFAGNDIGATRSAIHRFRPEMTAKTAKKMTNSVTLACSTPQKTSSRPSDWCHR